MQERSATALSLAAATALGLAGPARAGVTLIEDFESYASTAELAAEWTDQQGAPTQSLDAAGPILGQALRFDYDVSDGNPDTLHFDFPSALSTERMRTLVVWHQSAAGNSVGDLQVQLVSSAGVFFTGVLPGGTAAAQAAAERFEMETSWRWDLAVGMRIRIPPHAGGVGTLWFDAISLAGGTYASCRSCHGPFPDSHYQALSDGETWDDGLMVVHYDQMLDYDCGFCHTTSPDSPTERYPVLLGASDAGDPGGCVMCHGREEDAGNDFASPGRAAGLRRHHRTAIGNGGPGGSGGGCHRCHTDVNPWVTDPVPESVPPAFHAGASAPPDDPCDGSERFESPVHGLDNDGDGLYEWEDPDCAAIYDDDFDADDLRAAVDPCTGPPNLPPIDDSNGDGIPDACQCSDANGDGLLTAADVSLMNACLGGGSCDTTIVDANNDGAVTIVDVSLLSQVLSEQIPASSLTCARRPEGLAAASAFGKLHVGAGAATLASQSGELVLAGIGPDGSDGVGWHLGEEPAGDLILELADLDPFGTLPSGASLRAKLVGRVEGEAPEQLALISMHKGASGFELELNTTTLGTFAYRTEVRLGGQTLAVNEDDVGPAFASAPATGVLVRVLEAPPGLALHWLFSAPLSLEMAGWGPFVGDELVVTSLQAPRTPQGISSVELRAAALPELRIRALSSSAPIPALPAAGEILAGLLVAIGAFFATKR